MEAGDTKFFVSRGYVHVIGSPRGVGKSEGGGSREWDCYDLIEWIAAQPWCDGNVGMVGISGFGAEQLAVAKKQPPHLKAIFPFDSRGAYGELGGFRDEYPGGVIHLFRYLVGHFSAMHQHKGPPGPLPPEREKLWREAMNNPDYKMYPHVYNLIAQKGQHMPPYYNVLVDPFDSEAAVKKSEAEFADIKVPTYTGSGWYGYTYKTHLNGCQHWYRNIKAPKKLLLAGPAHLERPYHTLSRRSAALARSLAQGHRHRHHGRAAGAVLGHGRERMAHRERLAAAETQWTKLYLKSWERLTPDKIAPSSATETQPPDAFVQMPPSQTSTIQRLRYMTDPLPRGRAGRRADRRDALRVDRPGRHQLDRDPQRRRSGCVGAERARRRARSAEKSARARNHPRLAQGFAPRASIPTRSKPWWPWHPLTREASKPVTPGAIEEYQIEVMATANLFRQGHRICLDITSLDLPTGVAGATNAEYVPYHICSSKTVLHKIYHDRQASLACAAADNPGMIARVSRSRRAPAWPSCCFASATRVARTRRGHCELYKTADLAYARGRSREQRLCNRIYGAGGVRRS